VNIPEDGILQTYRSTYRNVRLRVFTAVTMKNGVFWDVTPCGSCKNRRFGGTSASVIRVTRIGELGTALAVTSNTKYFFAAVLTIATRSNIPEDSLLLSFGTLSIVRISTNRKHNVSETGDVQASPVERQAFGFSVE
jgi:hypothetical protein